MNKKIYPLHQEANQEQAAHLKKRHTKKGLRVRDDAAACVCGDAQIDCLDFLCDCGEPVSSLNFMGFDRNCIRLRGRCPVCGQKYDLKLKVNFPTVPVQLDNLDTAGYKTINRLRLKEV